MDFLSIFLRFGWPTWGYVGPQDAPKTPPRRLQDGSQDEVRDIFRSSGDFVRLLFGVLLIWARFLVDVPSILDSIVDRFCFIIFCSSAPPPPPPKCTRNDINSQITKHSARWRVHSLLRGCLSTNVFGLPCVAGLRQNRVYEVCEKDSTSLQCTLRDVRPRPLSSTLGPSSA